MKTIGLIGGMSWGSSAVYYNLINRLVNKRLGGFHSCSCIMISVDFAEIELLMQKNDWKKLDHMMAESALKLEEAGADVVILCTNTMHLCASAIEKQLSVPFLHIAEATGYELVKKGLKKVALLGTKFTMEKDFYRRYINEKFGIEIIIPDANDRETIHNIIFNELVKGEVLEISKSKYVEIINKLQLQGAEGVVLGCTEIPLLISRDDVDIPIFDTTKIHAECSVDWALR